MISRLINPHFGISAAFRRMTAPLMDIALDLPGLFTIHSGSEPTVPQQSETAAEVEADPAEDIDNDDSIYIMPICPWW